jgi:hypothetical protein
MAIQLNMPQSNFGVPFNGAYFRIVTAAASRQRDPAMRHTVMIDVVGYAVQPQSEDTAQVDFRRYHAPLTDIESKSGDNFLSKCYAWVMSQPDMNDATAV